MPGDFSQVTEWGRLVKYKKISHPIREKNQTYFNSELLELAVKQGYTLPSLHFVATVNMRYLQNDFLKFSKFCPWNPQAIAFETTKIVFEKIFRNDTVGSRHLSFEEAVSIAKKSSSAGFSFKQRGCKTRKDVFDNHYHELEKMVSDVAEGIDVPCIWETAPKVEIRAAEKLFNPDEEKRKVRTFSVADMIHYIIGLMCYSDQNEKLHENRVWSAIGTTQFHGGWHQTISRIVKYSKYVRCYDVSAFEASQTYPVQGFLYDMRNKYCASNTYMTDWYTKNLIWSILVDPEGVKVQKNGSNCSGGSNTLDDNTEILKFIKLYNLVKWVLKTYPEYSQEGVVQYVIDMYYELPVVNMGDDSMIGEHPDFPDVWDDLEESAKEMGFTFTREVPTDGDYVGEFPTHITRARFCNFASAYCHYRNMWYFVPNYDKLFAGLFYFRKKDSWRLTYVKLCAMRMLCYMDNDKRQEIEYYLAFVWENYQLQLQTENLKDMNGEELLPYRQLKANYLTMDELELLTFGLECGHTIVDQCLQLNDKCTSVNVLQMWSNNTDSMNNFAKKRKMPPKHSKALLHAKKKPKTFKSKVKTIAKAVKNKLAHTMRTPVGKAMKQYVKHHYPRAYAGVKYGVAVGNHFANTWNTHIIKIKKQREKVGDVMVDGNGNYSVVYTRYVNPGNYALFPILSKQADLYERYSFKKLRVVYQSQTSDAKATGGGLGRIMMAMRYDPTEPNFANSTELENYPGAVKGPVQENLTFDVLEARKKHRLNLASSTDFYTQYSNNLPTPSTSEDARWYDIGLLNVANEGVVLDATASKNLGELWVDYEIEFIGRKPPTANSVGANGSVPQYNNKNARRIPITKDLQQVLIKLPTGITPDYPLGNNAADVEQKIGNDYLFDVSYEQGRGYILLKHNRTNNTDGGGTAIQNIITKNQYGNLVDLIPVSNNAMYELEIVWVLKAGQMFNTDPNEWNPNVSQENLAFWNGLPTDASPPYSYMKYSSTDYVTTNSPNVVGLKLWLTVLPSQGSGIRSPTTIAKLEIPSLYNHTGQLLFSANDEVKVCITCKRIPGVEYAVPALETEEEKRIRKLEEKLSRLMERDADSSLCSTPLHIEQEEKKEKEKYLDPNYLSKSEISVFNKLVAKVTS